MKRRVVVTGLGCVTPLACEVDLLWQSVLDGKSGIHPLTVIDTTRHKVRFGGDVTNFDAGSIVEARDAKRLDRFTLFAMFAGHHAVRDRGTHPQAPA